MIGVMISRPFIQRLLDSFVGVFNEILRLRMSGFIVDDAYIVSSQKNTQSFFELSFIVELHDLRGFDYHDERNHRFRNDCRFFVDECS